MRTVRLLPLHVITKEIIFLCELLAAGHQHGKRQVDVTLLRVL